MCYTSCKVRESCAGTAHAVPLVRAKVGRSTCWTVAVAVEECTAALGAHTAPITLLSHCSGDQWQRTPCAKLVGTVGIQRTVHTVYSLREVAWIAHTVAFCIQLLCFCALCLALTHHRRTGVTIPVSALHITCQFSAEGQLQLKEPTCCGRHHVHPGVGCIFRLHGHGKQRQGHLGSPFHQHQLPLRCVHHVGLPVG